MEAKGCTKTQIIIHFLDTKLDWLRYRFHESKFNAHLLSMCRMTDCLLCSPNIVQQTFEVASQDIPPLYALLCCLHMPLLTLYVMCYHCVSLQF